MHRIIHTFLTLLLAALLCGSGRASAQGLVSVRLSGGATGCFGGGFQNVGANGTNVLQPMLGAGITINIMPQFRVGLGYDYSRMVREQLNGTLEPISGDVLPGSVEGTVYKDFITRFHAASVTAEYNVLPSGGPLSLYLGAGFGCLFADGNTWALSVKNEMRSDSWTSEISVNGQNEKLSYAAPYIPASISLEIRILPRTAVCLGGLYRQILSKNEWAPKGQVFATLGLRLDF